MKGIEKGRKKRNRLTLRGRFKEKQSLNNLAYHTQDGDLNCPLHA